MVESPVAQTSCEELQSEISHVMAESAEAQKACEDILVLSTRRSSLLWDDDEDGALPGGGLRGLAIRFNALAEGLEKTQTWIGGAASEAEEILQAAFERINILHSRLERLEVMAGLASPPGTPKEEGAQSPRAPTSPRAPPSPTSPRAPTSPTSPRAPRKRMQAAEVEPEAADPLPRCVSVDEGAEAQDVADSHDSFEYEGLGASSQRAQSPSKRCVEAVDPQNTFSTAAPSDDAHATEDKMCFDHRCMVESEQSSSDPPCSPPATFPGEELEGVYPVKARATFSTPDLPASLEGKWSSLCVSPTELIEGLRARMSAMEVEVRALGEKVAEVSSGQTTASTTTPTEPNHELEPCPHTTGDTFEQAVHQLVQPVFKEKQSIDEANLEQNPHFGGSPEAIRVEMSRLVANAEAGLRENLQKQFGYAAAELKTQCCNETAQLCGELRGQLQQELSAFQTSLVEELDAHSTSQKDLITSIRAAERETREFCLSRCKELEDQLGASNGELAMKVDDLGIQMRSFETTATDAVAVRARLEEDARLVRGSLDQRIALLEGEILSRGRMRAPPRSASGAGSHELGLFAKHVPSSAHPALDGMAQALSAIARVLGLVKDGDILGRGDWHWEDDMGCRLEQAWNSRAQELDFGSAALPTRAHFFDMLRAILAAGVQQQWLQQAGSTGTVTVGRTLPDRREAARLNAWLANVGGDGTAAQQPPLAPKLAYQQTPTPAEQQHRQPPLMHPSRAMRHKRPSSATPLSGSKDLSHSASHPGPGILDQALNTVERLRQTMG